jgi:hypothetical protein
MKISDGNAAATSANNRRRCRSACDGNSIDPIHNTAPKVTSEQSSEKNCSVARIDSVVWPSAAPTRSHAAATA